MCGLIKRSLLLSGRILFHYFKSVLPKIKKAARKRLFKMIWSILKNVNLTIHMFCGINNFTVLIHNTNMTSCAAF